MRASLFYLIKITFLINVFLIFTDVQSQIVIPQDSTDLEVVRVVLPENYWLCTYSEEIVIDITNNGIYPRSNFALQYIVSSYSSFTNADTITEFYQGNLLPEDTVRYLFSQLFLYSGASSKYFKLVIDTTFDSDKSNNYKIVHCGQDDPHNLYFGKVNDPNVTRFLPSSFYHNNTFVVDNNYSKVIVSLCQSNCDTYLSVSKCDGTSVGTNDNYCGVRSQLTLLNPSQGRYSADVNVIGYSPLGWNYTLEVTGLKTQSISIPAQWSIISSYLDLSDKSMQVVMNAGGGNVLLVKDEIGQVYWPQYNVNMIGNYNNYKAYQVKATNAFTLNLEAKPLDSDTMVISLNQGWNLLPYLKETPDSISNVLAPILQNISILKDGNGMLYLPEFNIDQILNLQPGKGYQIKMLNADSLIY